jgi:hypothetical protein
LNVISDNSLKKTRYKLNYKRTIESRTAEHDATSPSISIPASASAVLAANDPDAIQPSIPSFSMIVIKTSMVDFGNNSRRIDDTIA